MVKVAEYGQVGDDEPRAAKTVLLEGKDEFGRPLTFAHISEGWAIAGSMLRWDAACYAVHFVDGGATHGRRFRADDEGRWQAQELFAKWVWGGAAA